MKITVGALIVVISLIFVLPPKAISANLEWLGIVSGFGGAEKETGQPNGSKTQAGGRGTVQALGVIPFGPFGVQGSFQYTGGSGSRFGTTFGPLYDFTAGKVGLFATYQHRTQRDTNFWWLEPALDWYLGQMNLSLRYLQPVSDIQVTRKKLGPVDPFDIQQIKQVDIPVNRLQGTASYFPPDILQLGKDNLELTFGVQVNSFVGPTRNIKGAGVGPVFGIAMQPMQNVEFTLIRGTVDNRSRFDFQSGIRIFLGKSTPSLSPATSPSLKELRRKYMEASPNPVSGYTAPSSFRPRLR